MQWRRITEELIWKKSTCQVLGGKWEHYKEGWEYYLFLNNGAASRVTWRASWGLNLGSTAVPPLEGVAYCWQLWLGLQSCGHNSHDNHPTTSMYLSRTLQFPLYRRETGSERPMTAPGYSISNKVELNSRSHPRGLHSREKKLSLKAC